MAEIPRQREIIDRRALAAQLDALAESSAEPDRKRVAETLKAALAAGRAEVQQALRERCERHRNRARALPSSSISSSARSTISSRPTSTRSPIRRRASAWRWSRSAAMAAASSRPSPTSICFSSPLQGDAAYRAGGRVPALHAVGSGAQGRASDALGRGDHPPRPRRSHHPHRGARSALHLGRSGALRRAEAPLRDRDRPEERDAIHRGEARRARPAARAARRFALSRRAQRQGRQGRACAISTRCSGSRNTSIASTTSTSWSSATCCRRRRRSVSRGRRISSGRCAAISISSPAAPRTA